MSYYLISIEGQVGQVSQTMGGATVFNVTKVGKTAGAKAGREAGRKAGVTAAAAAALEMGRWW